MKVMTAKEAKNSFGSLIDTVQREPVLVTRRNRSVGVFFSIQDIEKIPDLKSSLLEHIEEQSKNSLLEMVGLNKDNRVYASAEEADKFIRELRDEWTH